MSENTRAFRKTRIGTVVSDKMDKTIVVAIETNVQHKLYQQKGFPPFHNLFLLFGFLEFAEN